LAIGIEGRGIGRWHVKQGLPIDVIGLGLGAFSVPIPFPWPPLLIMSNI
jgi:hypothetical protein